MSVSQLEEDQRTFLIVGGGEEGRRGRGVGEEMEGGRNQEREKKGQ